MQYVENGRVVTIEGNTSDAVHSRSYAIGSDYITGYCNPEYPAGTTIEIPEGMEQLIPIWDGEQLQVGQVYSIS